MEILPIQVSLLIDKTVSNTYELDSEQRCLLQKPKSLPNSSNATSQISKKIFFDHIQILEEPNELLVKQSKMEEQIQLLTSGFNAGIFTLNTRDPETKSNGLLIMALNLLRETFRELSYVRIFYCLLGLTDGRCIDLKTERSFQATFIKKKLPSLYSQASSIDDLIHILQQPFSFPYFLLIKLDGMYEFQSQLCLADLGWSHSTPKVPRDTPLLTQSLSKLRDIVHLLYQLPYHGRVDYDSCLLTALSKDFIGGNSRTSFIFRADLDDPETPNLLKFAEILRKVKHFVQPTRPDPSSFLKDEKLEKLSIDFKHLEYSIEQQKKTIQEQHLRLSEKENELRRSKKELSRNEKFTSSMKSEFENLQTAMIETQSEASDLTMQGFQFQLDLVQARENIKDLLCNKIRLEYECELKTLDGTLLESELRLTMIKANIQEDLVAFYLQQRQEMEESDSKLRQEFETLLQEYDRLAEHATEMKAKLKEYKHAEKNVVQLTKKIERLTEQYQQDLKELKLKLEDSEKNQQKLNEELSEKTQDWVTLSSVCQKKDQQLAELQRQLQQLESQLTLVTQELQTEKDQRDVNHQNLRQTFLDREKKSFQRLDQLRTRQKELQTDYDQLQFTCHQLQQDALDHESKWNTAQSKIKSLEKQLQQHRNQQKKSASKDSPEWEDMKETWDRQESELYKEIETLNAQLKKSEVQKKSAQSEIKRLQASLAGAESMTKELEETITTLNTKLKSKDKQVLDLQHDVQQHKAQFELLKEQLAWHEQKASSKDRQLETVNEQLQALKQELRTSYTELEVASNQLERAHTLRNDTSATRSKEKKLQQALNEAMEQLQKEKEKHKKELSNLQAQRVQNLEHPKSVEKSIASVLPTLDFSSTVQVTPTPIRPPSEPRHSHPPESSVTKPRGIIPALKPQIPQHPPPAISTSSDNDTDSAPEPTRNSRYKKPTPAKFVENPNDVGPQPLAATRSSALPRSKRDKKQRPRSPSPDSASTAPSIRPATTAMLLNSPTMLSPTLAALAQHESPTSVPKLRKKRKLGRPSNMLQILTESQSKLGNTLSFLSTDFNVPNLRDQLLSGSENQHV